MLSSVRADFLMTTIHASQPTTLTIELSHHEKYGGFAYRPGVDQAGVEQNDALIWINGRQLPLQNRLTAYGTTTVAERRGWHELVLVDLPLMRGANQVVIALNKGTLKSWFSTVTLTPQLEPALWALLEHDFPRRENHLLAAIPYCWFDVAGGWLTADTTGQEQQFITETAASLGEPGSALLARLAKLQSQHVEPNDPSWLDLCAAAAETQAMLQSLDALSRAVAQLAAAYPTQYPESSLTQQVTELREQVLTASQEHSNCAASTASLRNALAQLQREALVTRNPLLAGRSLLFIKRHTYDSDHYYDEFIAGLRNFGSQLCRLSLDDGKVTNLLPQLKKGIIDRYDLSFDGQRILFNYKPPQPVGFRVLEVNADGTGLRQVTAAPPDEEQRISTFATCSQEQLQQQAGRYGHWTDDMHPCYLPDGDIVFTSTRSQRSVLCGGHGLTVTNLYRVRADGTHLHQLSQGALSEFCPSVMNDGRILYNRWEYVDKGAGAVQSLWAMCPDGSR